MTILINLSHILAFYLLFNLIAFNQATSNMYCSYFSYVFLCFISPRLLKSLIRFRRESETGI